MNNENTTINKSREGLAEWIKNLIEAAKEDTPFSTFWFKEDDYDNSPFCIVGGWSKGFSEEHFADLLCVSKSNPNYAMCLKIAVNEGPDTSDDFDTLAMPINADGTVDDTCIALERSDDPMLAAEFFWNELERITKEHTKTT